MAIETAVRHCAICGTEIEMPADTLQGMAAAPQQIADAVRAAPARAGEGWSPVEIAVHLADTEIAWGWRLRLMLAADDPELQPYDQDAFASRLRYSERDVDAALATFTAVRADHVDLLRLLPEAAWAKSARHAEFGSLSVRTLIQHLSHHDLDHLRQIREQERD